MEKIIITANYRTLRIFYGVLGLTGAIIVGGHLFNYMASEMMESWFLNFIVGLVTLIGGGGLAFGIFKPALPEVIIDEKGMQWKRSQGDSSFEWGKLKKVELRKRSIRVQFAKSGAYDTLGIPYLVRTGNMGTLHGALDEACNANGLEFFSRL